MKKVTIVIPLLNGGERTVEAEIVGDLALHEAYKHEDLLSITHVPTLLTFAAAVPIEVRGGWQKSKRRKLLAWMKQVQVGLPKDWMLLRKVTSQEVKETPAKSQVLRDRIRAHCIGTK